MLDAQVLLAHVMERPRSWILAHPEVPLTRTQESTLENLISRIEAGEPLPYLLGRWEFFGLNFNISSETLIPRPETELLVEHALDWIKMHPPINWAADIGTGSGCIAVALAHHASHIHVLAADISLPALRVARSNAEKHGVERRVHFIQSDLLPHTAECFNLICANLPYIPNQILASIKVVEWEPLQALNGGKDGTKIIHRFIQTSPNHLSRNGLLLLEIDPSQAQSLLPIIQSVHPQAKVDFLMDLAGHQRIVSIQLND